MTYSEAIQSLYDLRLFGAKLGLDNTRKLAALAGNPQEKLRFIHVAGTNGKGSVCAILESIYRASGLKVGLYTSPHLVTFCERIQINRQLVSEPDVVRLLEQLRPLLKEFPSDQHPTFFEVVTVMALTYFAEQACDLVIWETGMGGRLDATNIVTPLASVITNIGLDHQRWLGETVEQIAFEKAGIIKTGVPVVTAATENAGLCVIRDTARQQQAALTVVSRENAQELPLSSALPLRGEFQKINAAVAIATVRTLARHLPVPDEAIQQGLSQVRWAGRMHELLRGKQRILLDGAHNPAGAEALAHELRTRYKDDQATLVFGVLDDKDWRGMLTILSPVAKRLVLVPVQSSRSLDPKSVLAECDDFIFPKSVSGCSSLTEALTATEHDSFIVITGSLYLVGEALELLHLADGRISERALNDWASAR